MEHNDKIKRERIQLAMMIGIYIAIALMIFAIIVLAKNVKEIKSDPIVYGIEAHGFEVCSCYDRNGNSYDYNSTGQIQQQQGGWNMDLSNLPK